jgi:DNA-binding MarR family transcriptional regulator
LGTRGILFSNMPARETTKQPTYHDGPWAHRLGHLLWEVSALANVLSEADLAKVSLTPRALGMLDKISAAPGSTAAELARNSPVTQQAVSQTVSRLEKLGYVERRLGSGRGVGLHLTDAGEAIRRHGTRAEQCTEEELRRRLGDELFDQLAADLESARDRLAEVTAGRHHSAKEKHP